MILSDHWYKNAVIYAVDVQSFQDGNGDGVGDFLGLRHRLGYLAGMGINCLWLLPFYKSPMRDNGYDISDYYSIDPRYGTMGDFVEFMREARECGIRVLTDLVVNHTSTEHPWFQEARKGKSSPRYDWYVWSEKKPEYQGPVVFPGEQDGVWTFDESAKAWYMHHFYEFQPDLNIDNPAVRDEFTRIMGLWLELGVSGFRVDAAPFLIDEISARPDHVPGQSAKFELLSEFRRFLDRRRGGAVLLAEANLDPDRLAAYFGQGDRVQLMFNFYLNQHLYLALARGDAEPIVRAGKQLPVIPGHCQWGMFLRTHDELTLDKLTKEERQQVMAVFAPDEDMRIYSRGIRRRLAPILNGDQRRIELAHSLLFTLPGSPILHYGDEIGMGDDLSLKGRDAVRTAMQWTAEENTGYSSAPRERCTEPLIRDGQFGNKNVNVYDQERNAGSLLNSVEKMIRIRRLCPEIGWGECRFLELGSRALLGHVMQWEDRRLLLLHNLSDRAVVSTGLRSQFDLKEFADLLGATQLPETGEIELGPYEYRWLKSGTQGLGLAMTY